MRISDWSSDVCSSDLIAIGGDRLQGRSTQVDIDGPCESEIARVGKIDTRAVTTVEATGNEAVIDRKPTIGGIGVRVRAGDSRAAARSEEHTSELQSLMRISYSVFCLKKKNTSDKPQPTQHI